jgi:hypothetical protein
MDMRAAGNGVGHCRQGGTVYLLDGVHFVCACELLEVFVGSIVQEVTMSTVCSQKVQVVVETEGVETCRVYGIWLSIFAMCLLHQETGGA